MAAVINRDWFGSVWKAVGAGQSIEWADLEWYALDSNGSIGMFSSTGSGPVPRPVFRDFEAYILALNFFKRSSPHCNAEIIIEHPRVDDWKQAAERGVYGFDYFNDPRSPAGYYVVARPEQALHVANVPNWLREWLQAVTLEHANFPQAMESSLDLSATGVEWL